MPTWKWKCLWVGGRKVIVARGRTCYCGRLYRGRLNGAGWWWSYPYIIWWRRGRVELPVHKKDIQNRYKLIRPFDLAPKTSTGEVSQSQLMSLWQPLSTSRLPHPD